MKKTMLLAAAFAAFGVASASALVYTDGDLIVGFRQTGATSDLVIDLGAAFPLTTATGTTNFGNVLGATSGLGGSGEISWSVGAAVKNSVSATAPTVINGTSYLSNALFLTQSSSIGSITYGDSAFANGAISTLGTNYQLGTAIGGSALLNNAIYVSPSNASSYSTLVPYSLPSPLNTQLESSSLVGSISVYLLNSTVPQVVVGKKTTPQGDLAPTLLGSFAISGAGDLTFTAAAIPEPSTYAGLLGVVTLGVVAIRRRRQAALEV